MNNISCVPPKYYIRLCYRVIAGKRVVYTYWYTHGGYPCKMAVYMYVAH